MLFSALRWVSHHGLALSSWAASPLGARPKKWEYRLVIDRFLQLLLLTILCRNKYYCVHNMKTKQVKKKRQNTHMHQQQQKKILIVTGDCPSHPYACAKLATVLARNHQVTLAGPNGSALKRLQAEAETYNKTGKSKIKCVSIGDVTTVVHCNVRWVSCLSQDDEITFLCE